MRILVFSTSHVTAFLVPMATKQPLRRRSEYQTVAVVGLLRMRRELHRSAAFCVCVC